MKYLFEAHFKDGSVVAQTPEDRSAIEPDTRSAYYDVVQKGLDQVTLFGLKSYEHTYVVDLTDGHFEIDGIPFSAQPATGPFIPAEGTFELVYFRDITRQFNVAADDSRPEEGVVHTAFRFGWKYEDPNGKRWEQTIVIT